MLAVLAEPSLIVHRPAAFGEHCDPMAAPPLKSCGNDHHLT